MKKVINPLSVKTSGGRATNVFCKIEIEGGNLSITGVVGPLPSGNCLGSCGQIDMDFKETYPAAERKYKTGWTGELFDEFLEVWTRWHLNDMNAACEHQRALGWMYEEHSDKETFKGDSCPVCGYSIGSAWLKEELPQKIIDFLEALPETELTPAWV